MRADDVFPKRFERLRVAEEAGDSDQQFPEERIHLQRGIPQIVDIVLDALDLGDGHSPLDAALDGVPLVQRKIMGRPGAKQEEDLLQKVRFGGLGRNDLLRPASESAPHIGDQLLRHFRRRQNVVHHSGEDGAARHPVVRRRIESLGHRHAAFALDHLETEAAVGAGAREDDADRPLFPVLRQRAEEEVDRQAQTARRTRFQQLQLPVQQSQVPVWRNDVDAVGLHLHSVLHQEHRHAGVPLDQVDQDALVIGGEMLHQDKRHADRLVARHGGEKRFDGRKSSGRGADADDGKIPGVPGSVLHFGRRGHGGRFRPFRFSLSFFGGHDRLLGGERFSALGPDGALRRNCGTERSGGDLFRLEAKRGLPSH